MGCQLCPPPAPGVPTKGWPVRSKRASGSYNFGRYCSQCHNDAAIGSTVLPDLRRSAALENRETWTAIVHGGALKDNGMISFAPSLSRSQVEDIRQYVIKRANEDKALESRTAAAAPGA